MKKVILIEEKCIGCGACMHIAPQNFTYNDEGRSKLISDNVTDAAIEASETCPTAAILIEDSSKEEECNCDECHCDESDCNHE